MVKIFSSSENRLYLQRQSPGGGIGRHATLRG